MHITGRARMCPLEFYHQVYISLEPALYCTYVATTACATYTPPWTATAIVYILYKATTAPPPLTRLVAYPNPLKNLSRTKSQNQGEKAEMNPNTALTVRDAMRVVLRPTMSAMLPHI